MGSSQNKEFVDTTATVGHGTTTIAKDDPMALIETFTDDWPEHPDWLTVFVSKNIKSGKTQFDELIREPYEEIIGLIQDQFNPDVESSDVSEIYKKVGQFYKNCQSLTDKYLEAQGTLQGKIDLAGKKAKKDDVNKVGFLNKKIIKIAGLKGRVQKLERSVPLSFVKSAATTLGSVGMKDLKDYTEDEQKAVQGIISNIKKISELDPAGGCELLRPLIDNGSLQIMLQQGGVKSTDLHSVTGEILNCILADKTTYARFVETSFELEATGTSEIGSYFRNNSAVTMLVPESMKAGKSSSDFLEKEVDSQVEKMKKTELEMDFNKLLRSVSVAKEWDLPRSVTYLIWREDPDSNPDRVKLINDMVIKNISTLVNLVDETFKILIAKLPPEHVCLTCYCNSRAILGKFEKITNDQYYPLVGGAIFLRYFNPYITTSGGRTGINVTRILQAASNFLSTPKASELQVGEVNQWLSKNKTNFITYFDEVLARGQEIYESKESFPLGEPTQYETLSGKGFEDRPDIVSLGRPHGDFDLGEASGRNNNCLIYSINSALGIGADDEGITAVRDGLIEVGLTQAGRFLENSQDVLDAIIQAIGYSPPSPKPKIIFVSRNPEFTRDFFDEDEPLGEDVPEYLVDSQTYNNGGTTIYIYNIGNYHFVPLVQRG